MKSDFLNRIAFVGFANNEFYVNNLPQGFYGFYLTSITMIFDDITEPFMNSSVSANHKFRSFHTTQSHFGVYSHRLQIFVINVWIIY